MATLRTNVIKYRYTFRVTFSDKSEKDMEVEAESIDTAIDKLPSCRVTASLLKREDIV